MTSSTAARKLNKFLSMASCSKIGESIIPSVPEIFQPVTKLVRNGNKYEMAESYKNLLVHRFTDEEKDFLCECYESKSDSVLGITSVYGVPRLTIPGIEKRYNIPSRIFQTWLTEYKNRTNNVKKRKYNKSLRSEGSHDVA